MLVGDFVTNFDGIRGASAVKIGLKLPKNRRATHHAGARIKQGL